MNFVSYTGTLSNIEEKIVLKMKNELVIVKFQMQILLTYIPLNMIFMNISTFNKV